MHLHLVVPVTESDNKKLGDAGVEILHGKLWHVIGPVDQTLRMATKGVEGRYVEFHCISYVWGAGREKPGSFFNNRIPISDQTRPALETAIRAMYETRQAMMAESSRVEAFWIDAICVPQDEGPSRYGTLESMGFIYSACASVIIVIPEPAWGVIITASMERSPKPVSYEDMQSLENDKWISSVWTYQELVNGRTIYFAHAHPAVGAEHLIVEAERFFNCVGCSLHQWKKEARKTASDVLDVFPNLNAMEDALADRQMAGYLKRTALGVLSNMALRTFDSSFPGNRLLASLGALTGEVSWGPPSLSMSDLAEKVMGACEEVNDYSFIYTSDERNVAPGLHWRPNAIQAESSPRPVHLIPIITWGVWGEPFGETQRAHKDLNGLWLDAMIPLQSSDTASDAATNLLKEWLHGSRDADLETYGFFPTDDKEQLPVSASMLKALKKMCYTGCPRPVVCETGYFFSQIDPHGREHVEMFASASMRWIFGAPGMARWNEEGQIKYSAGVFTGSLDYTSAESVLLA